MPSVLVGELRGNHGSSSSLPTFRLATNRSMDRIDFDTALPDEVYDLVAQGAPFPALYAGPLFVGKGGRDAQQALDDELSDLPEETGDEPSPAC